MSAARPMKLFAGLPSSSVPTPGFLLFEIRIADDDQAFVLVGDVEKAVHRMNRLLFVFRVLRAQRDRRPASWAWRRPWHISSSRRGAGRAGKPGAVTMRSEKSLLSMLATSKDAEAALAHRRVEIFAAQLDVENVPPGGRTRL